MRSSGDTIAAVATGAGGGIGIVRISGPAALGVGGSIFRGRGGRSLGEAPPFLLGLGTAVAPGSCEPLDEALAVWMPAGRSYTGETTVEIHAHGGPAVLEAVLQAAIAAGARLAEPGEFTKRAFLGGRLDLTQAEAVAAIIGAESELERRCALANLRGGLAVAVRHLRGRLLELVAGAQAALDFGDEEDAGEDPTPAAVVELAREIRELAGRGRAARVATRGPRVAIAGRPNSGKSSLFNVLVNFERSIVAPGPGTTRDYVEERAVIGGAAVTLIDTAGLRRSDDPVEAEGVTRSWKQIEESDLLVVLIDGSQPATDEDAALLAAARARSSIVVASKSDLPAATARDGLSSLGGDLPVFPLSTLTGEGLPPFVAALAARCRAAQPAETAIAVAPNLRHQEALDRAATALDGAGELLSGGRPRLDLAADELLSALAALDEITGEQAADGVIEAIFGRFCVGK